MKYSKPELAAILEKELRQSLGAPGTEISRIRLRNLQYYKAEATGELAAPDIPDRSSIVASDVADTVESMLPSLLRPFATSQDAMELEARRPDKSPMAKMASEYLRLLFWKRNRGFSVLYNWFKDALIQKVGFIKVVWEDTEEDAEESYTGLLATQVEQLMNDADVTILEQDVTVEVINGQPLELYSIKVKRVQKKGRCRVIPCPPEEMRVHPRSRYGEPLNFIAHQFYKTRAELEADGYDLANTSAEDGWHMEQIERASTQTPFFFDQSDGEMQRYLCSECYIKLDQDNDGIPEWRRVFMVGATIMEDDKVDDHPFVYFCPIPMPHVFFGMCPADQALDPQRLRTSLMRAISDNVYLTVNKRTEVVEGQVNLDDMLNSRPGGLVRVKQLGQMRSLEQGSLDQSAWQMVEWSEKWNEQRTGFTAYSKGLTSDALNPTATGVLTITDKADQRTELIARVAAETAVRVLFEKMLKCICRYQQKADEVELFGQWLEVDPREWVDAFNVQINIGLGTGNKDKQTQVMQAILQMQQPLVQGGVIPPQAAIMAARKFAENSGVTAPETYFPDAQPPQPQPDPEQAKMMAQGQLEQMKQQFKAQSDEAQRSHEAQIEQMKSRMQAEVDTNAQAAQERQRTIEQQNEAQLNMMKAQSELEHKLRDDDFNRWKARLEAETRVLVAQIGAESKEPAMGLGMNPGLATESAEPDTQGVLALAMQGFAQALGNMNQPKTIIRGPDGRAQGIA